MHLQLRAPLARPVRCVLGMLSSSSGSSRRLVSSTVAQRIRAVQRHSTATQAPTMQQQTVSAAHTRIRSTSSSSGLCQGMQLAGGCCLYAGIRAVEAWGRQPHDQSMSGGQAAESQQVMGGPVWPTQFSCIAAVQTQLMQREPAERDHISRTTYTVCSTFVTQAMPSECRQPMHHGGTR